MTRQIITISPDLSEGVQAEAQALEAMSESHERMRKAGSAEDYYLSSGSMAPFEYEELLKLIPRGAKILDVGVGFGHSSVFLASKGYKVFSVEPAISLCELIRDTADRFDLDIQVVQGVGEDLSSLGMNDFDAVIFNASLHHCDDPVRAIAEARRCLKPDGAIYLVNEFKLKPWETQKGFYRKLAIDPVGMGHYGGNEHAYHNSGYVRMLRTQFSDVEMLPPRRTTAVEDLRDLVTRRVNGEWVFAKSAPVLARFLFFTLRSRLRSMPKLYSLLARVSLVPVHFRGTRPTSVDENR